MLFTFMNKNYFLKLQKVKQYFTLVDLVRAHTQIHIYNHIHTKYSHNN